jgi:hypothetical protein
MPRIRAKPFGHKDSTGMPRNGRAMKLGTLESIADLEDALRIMARGFAQLGDYTGASRNVMALASIKFRAKELELKGLNLGEGQEFKFTATDCADRYQSEVAKNNELTGRVAALEAQIATMQGRDRPRPPRPLN